MKNSQEFIRLLALKRYLVKSGRRLPTLQAPRGTARYWSAQLDRRSLAAASVFLRLSGEFDVDKAVELHTVNLRLAAESNLKCISLDGVRRDHMLSQLKAVRYAYRLIVTLAYSGAKAFAVSQAVVNGFYASANYFLAGGLSATPVAGVESVISFNHGDASLSDTLNNVAADVIFLVISQLNERTLQVLAGSDAFIIAVSGSKKDYLFVDHLIRTPRNTQDVSPLFLEVVIDAYVAGARLRACKRFESRLAFISSVFLA